MTQPLRVLHVFARMDRGGAETMIMNLYNNIDRSKIQFDFVVHTDEKCAFDEEIQKLGGRIFRVPRYNGKNHLKYIKSWKEFFENNSQYRVIHGHVRSTASIYLKIAKEYGLTTIAHSHNTSSGKGFSAIIKNILQYQIRHKADILFACTQDAGEWLFGKEATKRDNFFILKNAIDAKKFIFNSSTRKRIRSEFKLDGKFVVGHVGRFHPQKNHVFLIDVFKEIYTYNKNVVLLLVGKGEKIDEIKLKVKKYGLTNNVIFTGVRSDIQDIFQAMDLFVFPSKYEGLGIVAIEAQAAGLPCIVSDKIPDDVLITNLIEKVPIKNKKVWASKILKYVNYKKRINTYKLIKEAGYDINETSIWLQKFYKKLIEGHNKNLKSINLN